MHHHLGSQVRQRKTNIKHSDGTVVQNPPASAGGAGEVQGQENPLEAEMATHSRVLT